MVSGHEASSHAQVGDWVEVSAPRGRLPRSGEIVEVIGAPGHERYRVRWDATHESILYPTDGTTIIAAATMRARGPAQAG